ncbi:MAG: hypothetical protein J5892_01135 [Bacilli bacterium]|nr:hypothetical protein [Bacilli bacterium]
MKTVSVIGSFRKDNHYLKVTEVINKLKSNDINVLSPDGTEVVDSVDDFVIFASDDNNLTPNEIEAATLEKILASDIVYVCDVDGYIGRTTAYEIGCCEVKNKEIYFLEYPMDFEINTPVNILAPDTLVKRLTNNYKK